MTSRSGESPRGNESPITAQNSSEPACAQTPELTSHCTSSNSVPFKSVTQGKFHAPLTARCRAGALILISDCAPNRRAEGHEARRWVRRARCLRSAETRDLHHCRFEDTHLVPEWRDI